MLEWARWATAEEGHRGPREYWDGVFPTNAFLDRFCRRCGDGLFPQEEEEKKDQEVVDVPPPFHEDDEPLRGKRVSPNKGTLFVPFFVHNLFRASTTLGLSMYLFYLSKIYVHFVNTCPCFQLQN